MLVRAVDARLAGKAALGPPLRAGELERALAVQAPPLVEPFELAVEARDIAFLCVDVVVQRPTAVGAGKRAHPVELVPSPLHVACDLQPLFVERDVPLV